MNQFNRPEFTFLVATAIDFVLFETSYNIIACLNALLADPNIAGNTPQKPGVYRA
jgi:hypothetical protein